MRLDQKVFGLHLPFNVDLRRHLRRTYELAYIVRFRIQLKYIYIYAAVTIITYLTVVVKWQMEINYSFLFNRERDVLRFFVI